MSDDEGQGLTSQHTPNEETPDKAPEDDTAPEEDYRDDEFSADEEEERRGDSPHSGTVSPSHGLENQSRGRESPVSVTYSDDGVDTTISDHYQTLVRQITTEIDHLKSSHFKDYTHLTSLQETTKHIGSHLKYNEEKIRAMAEALHETSLALNKLNATIIEKIENEHLESWLSSPLTSQDVAAQAGSHDVMSKAAELRQTVAHTEQDLANVTKLCADLELATVEAQQQAIQAKQAAEEAARRAEEAQRVAQEKLRIEEEKKRKAEDLARRQAEEERIRRENEEKRRLEMEQIKGTPEEQERINPNNWPTYTYRSETANDFDGSYCCIIRAMPGVMAQDDVTVSKISQLSADLPLDNNDELIGNIIRIEAQQTDEGDTGVPTELSLEEPLSILLPHCAPRSTSKEIIVMWRQSQDAVWVPLETKECNVESVKDAKLVECRPGGFGTFAVIFRLKTDHLSFTKKGGKTVSSVDSRLCIQCRPGAFRVTTNFTLKIQPVDLASVSDAKSRYTDECGALISSSPVVSIRFPEQTLKRPISIITPIPANSAKPKRPMTAVDKERAPSAGRPKSAAFGLGSYGVEDTEPKKDGEDELHLLTLHDDGRWLIADNSAIEYAPQNKKGDLICMQTNFIPSKFWYLRTKASTSHAQVEVLANTLYDFLHKRVVQFIMRQKQDDPTDITLVCSPSNKMERTMRRLDDDGYGEGTQISQEVFVREGQKVEIRFRGNLQPDEDVDLIQVFNSQLKTQVNMYIAEIDKYAQKSFNSYRGFAQFYIEGMVTKDIYDEADKKKGDQRKPIGTEEVWDSIMLAELLISLPKPEPEAPKPLKKAKINLISEGPIDDGVLRQLASDLGDEWKMLAAHLNVKKTRIQSIMRNHVNGENEGAIYEMLLTWVKRIPRSMDKVKVLCDALRSVGRLDLVEDVRDKEYDYKELRAEQLKDNHLKQMFIKIAQHPSGMNRWKEIAEYLDVTNTELLNIENEYSTTRERCLHALESWKDCQEGKASPNQLLKALKYLRLTDLAGEIRRMINH